MKIDWSRTPEARLQQLSLFQLKSAFYFLFVCISSALWNLSTPSTLKFYSLFKKVILKSLLVLKTLSASIWISFKLAQVWACQRSQRLVSNPSKQISCSCQANQTQMLLGAHFYRCLCFNVFKQWMQILAADNFAQLFPIPSFALWFLQISPKVCESCKIYSST